MKNSINSMNSDAFKFNVFNEGILGTDKTIYFQPLDLDNTPKQKNAIEQYTKVLNDLNRNINEQLGRDITPKEAFGLFANSVKLQIAEKHFYLFKTAFENTEIPNKENWNDIYIRYFGQKQINFNLNKESDLTDSNLKSKIIYDLKSSIENFDNLGFKSPNVIKWRKEILSNLEGNFLMTDFYYTEQNLDNKLLFQHIAQKEATYNFLNNKNLINTGVCPITGEKTSKFCMWEFYERKVYLSKKGMQVCKLIDMGKWNGTEDDKNNLDSVEKIYYFGNWLKAIIAVVGAYLLIPPTNFLSTIGFMIIALLLFYSSKLIKMVKNRINLF